jgi:propanol-preferring alcohol dehydrogenase
MNRMRAMRLEAPMSRLQLADANSPPLGLQQVRIAISACGVCRTDLHVVDGELPNPKLPIVPGHEIVGRIKAVGADVIGLKKGDRVGVPWLGWTCGRCEFCLRGQENLCPQACFTGYQIDGGFAEETTADSRYVFPLPASYSDESAAPLLCAGLIGWRALNTAGDARRLGIYGFGAAAHIVVQAARIRNQEVYAFVRAGDRAAEQFAYQMGAVWAGPSEGAAPRPLDAAIIFAPVGELVPAALRAVRPGGTVVCGGIHMSDIPGFPYSILWGERTLRSVANLTRADAVEFLAFAEVNPIHTTIVLYPLEEANAALSDLRSGKLTGAAVLIP